MAMVGGDSETMLVGGWPAVGGAVVGFNAADSACDDGNGDDAASGDCADMRRIVAVQVLKVHARCQVCECVSVWSWRHGLCHDQMRPAGRGKIWGTDERRDSPLWQSRAE